MIIAPNLDAVKAYAACGRYDTVPLHAEILSDFATPTETLRILKNYSTHVFMLESALADEAWGRYTFLGFDPRLAISCAAGEMKIGDVHIRTSDPSGELRRILASYRSPRIGGLPPFTGGLVGYFAFDYLAYREPSIRREVEDAEKFKDFDVMLFDKVIAFDNLARKMVIIANARLSDPETEYNRAAREIMQIADLVRNGAKRREAAGRLVGPVESLFTEEAFCAMVERAKRHIREGDIVQIVLSNRLSAPFDGSLLNAYRLLRAANPSPYMFYFSGSDIEVAGSSPATLVKLENGVLHACLLTGTRPRGRTEAEDHALEETLLRDARIRAEHDMLVDLGRSDLGRISKFGTVEIEKLHVVERHANEMRIGSTVRGEMRDDCDALSAIEAVLPAGMLSGAPKIRACQLIGEIERRKRGIYGGAIGYVDFMGNMDTCIAIHTAYKKNGRVFVRSGAGIVADSDPRREFRESLDKAKAILKAFELAEEKE